MSITVSNFSFQYQNHQKILNQVNFKINDGQLILLTGPSGSGKSTLLKWMGGLYPQFIDQKYKVSGEININGKNIKKLKANQLSQNVVMMFQNPNHQFTMPTVNNEMIFALENQRVSPNRIQPIIDQVLSRYHLNHFKHRQINTLSGGEKQQVALAIIMAMNSKVILLDEPFANVDFKARKKILNILKQLKQNGKTIIIVDHDLNQYEHIADCYLYLFNDGHIDSFNHIQSLPNYKWFHTEPQSFQLPNNHQLSPAITLANFQLLRGNKKLLSVNQFHFFMNKITLITGDNGIGKSTLFEALIKLIKYQGDAFLGHQNIKKIKNKQYFQKIGMTFQDAEDQFIEITVQDEIKLSMNNANQKQYSKKEILKWLKRLNLIHHLKQTVYTLSEGQQKKLQIISMLIMHPQILLMDEPFQGIDYASLNETYQLLKDANQNHHQTMIIISHQLADMDQLADYHIQFQDQKLIYSRQLK